VSQANATGSDRVEGRDAAGRAAPSAVHEPSTAWPRVVALEKPTDRNVRSGDFQRYVNTCLRRAQTVLFTLLV